MKEENVLRKPEPEEMKRLTPPPRRVSRWVLPWLVVGQGPWVVMWWVLVCVIMVVPCGMPAKDVFGVLYKGFFGLFILIFIGYGVVKHHVWDCLRKVWLMRYGEIGRGRVTDFATYTDLWEPDRDFAIITFAAQTAEYKAEAEESPEVTLNREAIYEVLYDPKKPEKNMAFIGLPYGVKYHRDTFVVPDERCRRKTAIFSAIHGIFMLVVVFQVGITFGWWNF